MNQKLFSNSYISELLGIPQRRIINITEKGLVIPPVEASGAGSKRQYSYLNLLEFGLIGNLFDIGFGIHLVKRILVDLRKDGDIKAWAEGHDSYFLKVARSYLSWVNKQQEKTGWATAHLLNDDVYKLKENIDPENMEQVNRVKDKLRSENKNTAILFYCFKEDGSRKKNIVPWGKEDMLATIFLQEDIYTSKGIIILNLGKIKEEIDKKIEEMKK
jgi:DNA-binding transcriptional MerR regulator